MKKVAKAPPVLNAVVDVILKYKPEKNGKKPKARKGGKKK
jgi:hypothetical protein